SSVARPIQPARGTTAKQEQMNKAASFPNCGQIRSMTATGTKTSSQLIESFSNDFMLVIPQVSGTNYNGEHKSLLIDWSLGIIVCHPVVHRFVSARLQAVRGRDDAHSSGPGAAWYLEAVGII